MIFWCESIRGWIQLHPIKGCEYWKDETGEVYLVDYSTKEAFTQIASDALERILAHEKEKNEAWDVYSVLKGEK